jgi:hypothetical protein
MTTTAQTGELSTEGTKYRADKAEKEKDAINFGEQLANLVSGDANKADAAVKYFAGLGIDLRRGTTQIEVSDKSGNFIPYAYGNKSSQELEKAIVSALNVNGLPEDLILKNAARVSKGRNVNTKDSFEGITRKEKPVEVDIPLEVFTTGDFFGNDTKSIDLIQTKLPQGFSVKEGSGKNDIDIVAPSGAIKTYNSRLDKDDAAAAKKVIEDFIKKNIGSSTQGVGGKYN